MSISSLTQEQRPDWDAIIIGAGAAGLMCAAQLGFAGMSTLVLDHANKVGKKILMSGGGRCNFTNEHIEPGHYISDNPHFCKSALSRYTQHHFIELVEKYNIGYHEKAKGQLFCDGKSKDILNMLLNECNQAHVTINTKTSIAQIAYDEHQLYRLLIDSRHITTRYLIIATGGLSIPTMGASGFGYQVAQQFGLNVKPRHAALVPFILGNEEQQVAQSLAGVALPVSVSTGQTTFTDDLLFTHKGLSGPAILQISNYWWPQMPLTVNFSPNTEIEAFLLGARHNNSKKSVLNLLSSILPRRFVEIWLGFSKCHALLEKKPAQLSNDNIQVLAQAIHCWSHTPKGTEGYKTAEVTRGGVDTHCVSSKTFEAVTQPRLYFIGEVLDVTGWLGGFNFQWAWASGWCAAQGIIESYRKIGDRD